MEYFPLFGYPDYFFDCLRKKLMTRKVGLRINNANVIKNEPYDTEIEETEYGYREYNQS